jgi:hypothetical protein
MVFLMNDAASRRHPLDVTRPDYTAIACRIVMFDLAVIDDGDGLEAAVRMLADATPLRSWLKVIWPGVIEQEERADVGAEGIIGEKRANGKTVADPMLPIIPVAANDFLTHVFSSINAAVELDEGRNNIATMMKKDCKKRRSVLQKGRCRTLTIFIILWPLSTMVASLQPGVRLAFRSQD